MRFIKYLKLGFLFACTTIFSFSSHASTSLTLGGHAGAVAQYLHNLPPLENTYWAAQVPVGLILQANPFDDFSVVLELDYAYSNYPIPAILLGETQDVTLDNESGTEIPLPFANSIFGGSGFQPFGQKVDTVQLIQAYFSYDTPFGLFRAGRFPRNWGLGIWYDSYWTAQGSGISTSDALAFTTDFGMYDVTVYYERYGQSIGGLFNSGSASAYTFEGRLKTSPTDLPSTGVSRNIGILYSYFMHPQSDTNLSILDVYGKFYFPKFFLGGEILFPSGNTKNPNYQTVGGAPLCKSPESKSQTCSSQKMSSLGALAKFKYRFDSPTKNSTYYAVEKSQTLLGTRERQTSHVGELWAGYASGGSNQFDAPDQINIAKNRISAIRLNPNILPSLLMFTNTLPLMSGMPTASITNSTFVRASYTYQSNFWGSITPAVIWGMINFTNHKFNESNDVCSKGPSDPNYSSSLNNYCVGGSRNLGTEFNLTYAYTTTHLITAQVDAGYWLIGNAWQRLGEKISQSTLGVRAILQTQF